MALNLSNRQSKERRTDELPEEKKPEAIKPIPENRPGWIPNRGSGGPGDFHGVMPEGQMVIPSEVVDLEEEPIEVEKPADFTPIPVIIVDDERPQQTVETRFSSFKVQATPIRILGQNLRRRRVVIMVTDSENIFLMNDNYGATNSAEMMGFEIPNSNNMAGIELYGTNEIWARTVADTPATDGRVSIMEEYWAELDND